MPRTLDATLEAALDAGNYSKHIIRGWLGLENSRSLEVQVISYRLTSTNLEMKFHTPTLISGGQGQDYEECTLERGLQIGETEYTVFTTNYQIMKCSRKEKIYTVNCEIGTNNKYTANGDDTYENVINAWFTGITTVGYAPTYQNPSANWLDYQFLADGKQIILNQNTRLIHTLAQKYMIFIADYQDNELLVFSVHDTFARSIDHTITVSHVDLWIKNPQFKQYRWIDENGTYNISEELGYPTHNLGYLESTANHPITNFNTPNNNIATSYGNPIVKLPFHLKYVRGDKVSFRHEISTGLYSSILAPLDITEILEPDSDIPWRIELTTLNFLSNTEGGQLPSTIERISNYTPLNTSGFDGILSEADNNLQAAMETIDDFPYIFTTAERNALTPTTNLIIFNSTTSKLNFWDGATWRAITST